MTCFVSRCAAAAARRELQAATLSAALRKLGLNFIYHNLTVLQQSCADYKAVLTGVLLSGVQGRLPGLLLQDSVAERNWVRL